MIGTMSAAPADVPSQAPPSTVGVIIDEPSVRDRVRSAVHAAGMRVTAEAGSVTELVTASCTWSVDAVVVRTSTRRLGTYQALESARSHFPDVPLVAIWPTDERRDDRRALRTGIGGLLGDDQIEAALVPTIRAVADGLVCIPKRGTAASGATTLSSREKQVLGMLILGFTNAEIGRRLYLAESTVKSHLSSAYLKLGVRSRKDAAALILDPDDGLGTGILALASR